MISSVSDIHCSHELIGDCQLNGQNKAVSHGHVNTATVFHLCSFYSFQKTQECHLSLKAAILAKPAEMNGMKVYRTANA